ncbi:MAG TPA: hypothetical protein VES20_25095 [Bryobacteraceae bacterium]|nr:hypothetical protein [Bryobacteraceae bacterium]
MHRLWREARAPLIFYAGFLVILIGAHLPVLSLPYFWDELGQFIPAALDLYRDGAWVPKSTLPNVHPPGVMAILAAVWSVTGYGILTTRLTMLALAALGVLGTFLLAIELCRKTKGVPALFAAGFLLASPLFWAQSMMAQLDMPAMVFTTFGLLLFLRERFTASALVCTALVLMKESSLAVPAVFGVWLLAERRLRPALLFLLPLAAVAGWLWALRSTTGHWLGNSEFTHYNVWFQLHPVRLPLTVARRIWYLLLDNMHWVGTAAIMRSVPLFRTRAWAVTAAVAALQTTAVSVLGGAALERYLMPVLPLFYIAAAAAITTLTPRWQKVAPAAMFAGLLAGLVINSPLAYPFENNTAFVSFVRLQRQAAEVLQADYPDTTVWSAWPFPDALRRPEFGYVERSLKHRGLDNFDSDTVLRQAGKIEVLVIYSRTWEPEWGALQLEWVRDFLARYYFYKPQISPGEIEAHLGLTRVARWEERGQWIEIWARNRAPNVLVL